MTTSDELRKKFNDVAGQLHEVEKRDKGFTRTAAVEFFKTGAAEFFHRHHQELERLLWPEPSAAELDEMTTEPKDQDHA